MKDSVDKDLGIQTPGYSQSTLHLPMCCQGEGSICAMAIEDMVCRLNV